MVVSCTVDSIMGKMGLVDEKKCYESNGVYNSSSGTIPTGYTCPQVQDAECTGCGTDCT